jgi:hypothetical protein
VFEVLDGLGQEGSGAGPLVRQRGAIGVVLVVGVRQAGGLDDLVELPAQGEAACLGGHERRFDGRPQLVDHGVRSVDHAVTVPRPP